MDVWWGSRGAGEKGNEWTSKYYLVVGEQEWEKGLTTASGLIWVDPSWLKWWKWCEYIATQIGNLRKSMDFGIL